MKHMDTDIIQLTEVEKFDIALKECEDRIRKAVEWFQYKTNSTVKEILIEPERGFEMTKVGPIPWEGTGVFIKMNFVDNGSTIPT